MLINAEGSRYPPGEAKNSETVPERRLNPQLT